MEKLVEGDITIQALTFDDLNQVLEIENASFKDPWSKGMFIREVGTDNFYVLREKNSKRLLGYFGYWQLFAEFHITNLAVAPEYRLQGIGSFILNYLLSEAKRKNCRRVLLEVRATNLPAQKLYFKFDFEIIGKRKKYYSDGEEALLLEKKI